jgi:hypothetical protein
VAATLLLGSGVSSAQQSQPLVPAPDRDGATGLVLPPRIATAVKVRSTDYGKSMGRPELGYSWHYQTPGLLSASVYVYTMAVRSIPDGPSSSLVLANFQQALGEIETAAKYKRYEQLKTIRGPADCPAGSVIFRCITLSAIQGSNRMPIYTALMVTGYRNHFLKLRLDWVEGSVASQAEVDRFVQTLAGAILR